MKENNSTPGPVSEKSMIREKGVYLITGGMGELGYLFAQYLAQKAHAGLVLTGRHVSDDRIHARLGTLQAYAKKAVYVQADIADFGDVKALAGVCRAEFGGLNGILHAAGVIRDSFILKKNEDEIREVLSAKVQGTNYLDEAFSTEKLDFFVMFSSIASVFGNVGQSDYGFANGYMDCFAMAREKLRMAGKRYGKTLSINWPLWESGMSVGDAKLRQMKDGPLKLQMLSRNEGIRAFETGLLQPYPQLIVIKGDEAEIDKALDAGMPPKAPEQDFKSKAEATEQSAAVRPRENMAALTRDYLKKLVSLHTKVPVNKIRTGENFGNYGIESVTIMNLTKTLESDLGEVSKTLFFEYENIDELAEYLMQMKGNELVRFFGKTSRQNESKRIESTSANDVKQKKKVLKGKKAVDLKTGSGIFEQTVFNADSAKRRTTDDIAIIGVSGRYPMADTIEEFWNNLQTGRDCITEIPGHRWNHQNYYDREKGKPGKTYSKWGGFINNVEMFDPLFFKVPPVEAEFLDPQERLYLQTVWEALEDAGYTIKSLSHETVGVFAGIMYALYQMYETDGYGGLMTGRSSFASVANRVSYFFDFKGPSIALDTMCSSSLTALYLGCESIRNGTSTMAVAGGVNLTLHPNKYVQLSQGGFLSTDGRCRSFGEGGDGYVPGEGVGAVILKPLKRAVADGDNIYGVIKSISVNAGGKTSGYTVPNLNAQRELIKDALEKGNIDARTVSFIEAHGTGTALGDPIEINALSQAYDGYSKERQYCAVGSLKSNIGHLESAAGVAAVTKVLLQMKHKKLVPSLHSEKLNPLIHYEKTPFYVQHGLSAWKRPEINGVKYPRRAGISAFGAGGSNAHMILEEYDESRRHSDSGRDCLFVLSAKNTARLKEYAAKMHRFIEKNFAEKGSRTDIHSGSAVQKVLSLLAETLGVAQNAIMLEDSFQELGLDEFKAEQFREAILSSFGKDFSLSEFMAFKTAAQLSGALGLCGPLERDTEKEDACGDISLEDIAYTLQVGREAMEERIAVIAADYRTLLDALDEFVKGNSENAAYKYGNVNDYRDKFDEVLNNAGFNAYLSGVLAEGKYEQVADFWVMGAQVDWSVIYRDDRHFKISLPTYPFVRERCWILPESRDGRLLPDNAESAPVKAVAADVTLREQTIGKIGVPEKNGLKAAAADYIKKVFSAVLKIPYESLSETQDYQNYGIDSIYVNQINKYIQKSFGKLPATLLFTYKNINALADYLVREQKDTLLKMLNVPDVPEEAGEPDAGSLENTVNLTGTVTEGGKSDIAVIGISGRFPKADSLDEYFKNLEEARDCISPIPVERWNPEKYPDIACKWGGFIDDVDKFDPQFFNIAPLTASFMDPQERLYLEAVWSCLEDAGYTPSSMERADSGDSRGNVAVYAGVTFNEYGLYGAADIARGKAAALNSQIYSVANRISYLFNFGGPSLSVDTACSSSLYAVHLGCESILRGEAEMAVAGGVNLSLHPSKYITLNRAKFLASDGHCRTFGKGGDGYVPGEGVGAVLLKPLCKAEKDGDHIYAVIKGSAVNHGGKTYGYSVPNPVAQTEVIEKALKKSGVTPRTISYVEAHGTGTSLGDPIEITALTEAYRKYTSDRMFCPIGSVKSNIGHLEAAAGISQLIKVILQMKNRELVPSRLNTDEMNPDIDFANTPFYVQQKKEEWKRPVPDGQKECPRRAGISAFGVGGVNIHMIVEEYDTPDTPREESNQPVVIPLSAKNEKALLRYAEEWLDFIRNNQGKLPSLTDAAYTMQTGRITLAYRAAFVVSTYGQLQEQLKTLIDGGNGIYVGKAVPVPHEAAADGQEDPASEQLDEIHRAASLWISGKTKDFSFKSQDHAPKRVSLPTYPFEKESYWMYSKDDDEIVKEEQQTGKKMPEPTAGNIEPQNAVQNGRILEKLKNAFEDQRMEMTVHHIQDVFARLLGFTEGRLPDADEGFFALGLESVATKQAYNLLEDEFEVELDEQIFFNYPNITEVSAYILSLIDFENGHQVLPEKTEESEEATLYFEHVWKRAEELKTTKTPGRGKVLFAGINTELANAIERAASETARKNITFAADRDEAISMMAKTAVLPDKIVFMGNIDALQSGVENIGIRVNSGIIKLFETVKVLYGKVNKTVSLLFVYQDDGSAASAEYGGVQGFFRALQMESPKIMCKTVCVSPNRMETGKIAEIILKELKAGCAENEIAYKDNRRYVRQLSEIELDKTVENHLLKENKVYLITGGLGGLGKIFAEYLIKKYRARLILTGRRQLEGENREWLKGLETPGGKVCYMQADISKRGDVTDLVQKSKESFGQINGVIHAAGIVRDAIVKNKSEEDFKTAIAAKVYGAQYLDEALKDEQLDFFIMFSSLAAVFGNIGLSDYCYANNFLDYFACVREEFNKKGKRYGKTCSINWSFWKDGGIILDDDSKKWMEKKIGLLLMDNEAGLKAFERATAADVPNVILMNGHPGKIRKVLQLPEPEESHKEKEEEERKEKAEIEKLEEILPENLADIGEDSLIEMLKLATGMEDE